VKRRLKEHRRKGSHFTGYNPLKKLLYVEEFSDRPSAKKREAQIKRWSRAKKLALISGDFELLKRL
jgi:putative endonuclease